MLSSAICICQATLMHLKRLLLHMVPRSLRRKLYRYLILDGRKRYDSYNQWGNVQRTLFGFVIKGQVSASEYAATRFIRQNTNIPVPFIYDYLQTEHHGTYFVMQAMPCMSLLDYQAQFGRPSEEQQNALAHQVKRISEELRRVRPLRGRKICRFDGSALDDPRIQLLGGSFGPFDSVEDFQDALLGYSVLEIPEDEKEPVMDRITRAFSSPRAVVLTHGDLTPANILVDKDLKITGVIDWATASWMPDYWELIKSIFLLQYRRGYWRKVMEQVYPGYGDVVEADQLIQKYRRVYT